MNIAVDSEVFERFHEKFMVGVLLCSNVKNAGDSDDIHEMLVDIEELMKLNFTPEELSSHELISSWKSAIAAFGPKFAHYKSNVEVLMQKLTEGEELPRKDKISDLVTFMSLKYLVPIGAFDASALRGKVHFTTANGHEQHGAHHVEKGELILRDRSSVLSRKLHVDPDPRAAVTEKTTHALVLIEAVPPFTKPRVEGIMDELGGLIRIFCGGKVKKVLLSRERQSAVLL